MGVATGRSSMRDESGGGVEASWFWWRPWILELVLVEAMAVGGPGSWRLWLLLGQRPMEERPVKDGETLSGWAFEEVKRVLFRWCLWGWTREGGVMVDMISSWNEFGKTE